MDEELQAGGSPQQTDEDQEAPGVAEVPPGAGAVEADPSAQTGDTVGAAPVAEQIEERGATTAPSFEELADTMEGSNPAALALLYDLDLPVSIELGRTRLSLQDVLALGRGSVVQLDRQAGEPVDIFVGDRRFAEGEVVIVGEQFGVRITRIVSTVPVAGALAV